MRAASLTDFYLAAPRFDKNLLEKKRFLLEVVKKKDIHKKKPRKHKKLLAIGRLFSYSSCMSSTFPLTAAELEEYVSIMNELCDLAQASAEDPEPNNFA